MEDDLLFLDENVLPMRTDSQNSFIILIELIIHLKKRNISLVEMKVYMKKSFN